MEAIENSEALTRIFGYWPSFHDAEVLTIFLNRQGNDSFFGPTVDAAVHVFEMTSQVNTKGHYALRHHTLVSFRFFQVAELRLDGFNYQNVLWSLDITDISERQMEEVRFKVSFHESFGVEAGFVCRSIAVLAADPFIPSD